MASSPLKSRFDPQSVIDAGHPPVAAGIVCIDYDGTIFPFGMIYDENQRPLPGAVEAVQGLKQAGYTIIIWTSRLSAAWHIHEGWDHTEATKDQLRYMRRQLRKWKIPFDGFSVEKIPAEAYFDDKAYRAYGHSGLLNAATQFTMDQERKRSAGRC